jgi:hypothetical protein
MARICEDIIVGYDPDDGSAIIEEQCYDDGSNETSSDLEVGSADYAGFDWGTPPGEEGSNAVVDSKTGNITYTYREEDGSTSTLTVGPNGVPVSSTESPTASGNSTAFNRALAWTNKNLGSTAGKVLSNMMANPGASLMTALAAAKAFSSKSGDGYSKPVPKLDAVRQQIQYTDPNRRPGEAGRQYFTDPRFVAQGDAASLAAAQAASTAQSQGILGAYSPAAAPPAVNPYAGTMPMKYNPTPAIGAKTGATDTTTTPAGIAAIPTQEQLMDPNYTIGAIGMASGGIAMAKGRYLDGDTDGMADKISTTIDGDQEAALSHGEFVIPADVVSHLGNGNSDAGAQKLYEMMDRIREARTGTKEQGKEINPDKFMPGGLATSKYATGGPVQRFQAGGTPTSAGGIPLDTSTSKSLSPWAGDYVTNFLGQGAALANAPMQTYGGPLTAGASDLQQQSFAGISDVAKGGFDPTTFTSGTFDTAQANKYMNPYLQATLNPQLEELRRQSKINLQPSMAKLTQAGGYGGGRQAIMESEANRNLLQEQNKTVGQGYSNAFDKAMAQFNAEQNRGLDTQKASELSRQYSADFGLKSLNDLMSAGKTQRDITSEGIAADKKQFEEQQAYPFNMVEFQRKLVEGLPIGSTTTGVNQDAVSKMQSDVSGLASLYSKLANLKLT